MAIFLLRCNLLAKEANYGSIRQKNRISQKVNDFDEEKEANDLQEENALQKEQEKKVAFSAVPENTNRVRSSHAVF